MTDAAIVCRPRGALRLNRPLLSVSATIDWLSTKTATPLMGWSVRSSITTPAMVPVCTCAVSGCGGAVITCA